MFKYFCEKLFLLLLLAYYIQAKVEFTNVQCKSLDAEFDQIETCALKSINRTYKYISVKVNMHQLPVRNASVSISVMKKSNRYQPVYDTTIDLCKYLRMRNNYFYSIFFGFLSEHSNINHTCPYNHDIIVDKLPSSRFNDFFMEKLPLATGEYAIMTTWNAHNVPRCSVNIFVVLK